MYDYATVTKQNQIIQQIETTNNKLDNLTNKMETVCYTIIIVILIIAFKEFVYKILGGR